MVDLFSLCADGSPPGFSLADVDFCVLHSPFVKMVRKGFARLVYQDHLRAKSRSQARQARCLPHFPLKVKPLAQVLLP